MQLPDAPRWPSHLPRKLRATEQGARMHLAGTAKACPFQPPSEAMAKRPAFHRDSKRTTTERGYGWRHQQMRDVVLREEPLCRSCLKRVPPICTPSVIADHIVPQFEGGTDERENYQGLCVPCSDAKTAEEAARARGAKAPRRRVTIGDDGWPKQ